MADVPSVAALDRGGGGVLLVCDVVAPCDGVALVVDFLHRHVGHEAVGGRAVPVVFASPEEHAVARTDDLDRTAAALAETDAFGHVDGLAVGMGVPGGSCAWRE